MKKEEPDKCFLLETWAIKLIHVNLYIFFFLYHYSLFIIHNPNIDSVNHISYDRVWDTCSLRKTWIDLVGLLHYFSFWSYESLYALVFIFVLVGWGWLLELSFLQELNSKRLFRVVESNVVYSVSAPVSVWPLERNISVPVRFGVPFRVYRKYIYIKLATIDK